MQSNDAVEIQGSVLFKKILLWANVCFAEHAIAQCATM